MQHALSKFVRPSGARARLGRAGLLVLAGSFGPALGLGSCQAPDASAPDRVAGDDAGEPTVERVVGAMGTLATVRVWADARPPALRASETIVRALEAVEERLSTWRDDTELARLNAAPVGVAQALSPATLDELRRALDWSRRTQRAFDPCVGALVSAWDLRGAGAIPSDERVAGLVRNARYERLDLDAGASRAARLHADALVEEGGFGKGAGLDVALSAFDRSVVHRAVVDLGGQLAFYGTGAFTTPVSDPGDRARPVLRLELPEGSLATTGNVERRRTVDGRLVGHVLDPRTGRPAHADDPELLVSSASVWTASALDADALSTALFVLGPAEGLALVEDLPGVEAVFLVPADAAVAGGPLHVHPSSGLADRLTPLEPERLTLHPASAAAHLR